MERNILRHFSVNYKEIIIDEIALNGLEGIGLDLLWRRVGKRISSDVTEKMQIRYWGYIINCGKVYFYRSPKPLPYVEVLDRFDLVDETTGNLKEPDDYLDGPYEYVPIEGEHGSCEHYHTRTAVPIKDLQNKPYEKIVAEYGEVLTIVAHVEERWRALAPHVPSMFLSQMNQVQYCLLELIGKARENGQMTIGKTNLSKILKDPKTLFYIRKFLRDLDLIRTRNLTQIAGGKGVKSLLVRLKRFNQPCVLSMPRSGILHNVVEYLLEQPNYSEKAEVIVKKGFITQKQSRKLQKTVNIFNFDERIVTAEDKIKKTKGTVKKKIIYLSSKSDESSESDEESQEPPLKCQYKVGVSLMRQAYERFLDAGLEGLTQVQLAQLLGIEFYTSRGICRVFRLRNIVREYLEDRGKQRTARFIAVAATGEMDVRYAEEKKKFLEYLGQQNNNTNEEEVAVSEDVAPIEDEDVIPLKRIKLEKDIREANTNSNDNADMAMEPNHDITEIKVLDGFESVKPLGTFKKNPTLRQLTFANGIFKVLKEKLCVGGYLTLSNLVSKIINEPPLDTKALKSFIQKLVTDGHIKMYKLKWPGLQKYSVLICAKHVKKTHPLVKAKYKEICMRAVTSTENKKVKIRKENAESYAQPLSQFSYPRYMKIQILHEALTRIAYFEPVKPESHTLPPGFISIVDFMQEVTVEFIINNMGTMGVNEVYQLITESLLQVKLKDAPQNVYKALLRSNNLQNSIRLNLKVLAMLGLIQLVRQGTQTSNCNGVIYSSFLFYVNRHAKILDTMGIWPRKTSDEKVIERSFYFETYDDVVSYWNEVYHISTNTVIEVSNRGRKQLKPPQREENEVFLYDNGARYGDGNGPCGFDSCFYMELPRLWRSFYMRPIQANTTIKKKVPVKKPKTKKKKSKPEPVAKPTKVTEVVVKPSGEKQTRKRTDTSVRWTKQEDMIITMCKAAITILSPNSQPGSLIVRNTVARDILSIKDPRKTKGTCHTRAATLDTNSTFHHEKQCIINELRRRRNLVQKYEGLLKKLRLKYSSNMSKFINKARLPMMELVWIINEVMHSDSYIQKVPCVALNLEDFHEHFTIVTSSANKVCNIYKTPENVTLKECILFSIMQTYDAEISTETAKKIYKIFKEYPELDLRNSVEQLRKCGAIAAKEKIFNNQMRKLDVEDISHSSYKISAFYLRKWVNRFNSEFADNIAALLDAEQSECDVKGSAEINCVYCELHACNVIDMMPATLPVITDPTGVPISPEENNALTIDTKYRLKTGTLKLKYTANVNRLSDLFQDFDVSSAYKYLSSGTSVDVKDLNQNLDLNDPIISYLNKKAEKGATFMELKDTTGHEDKYLIKKLQHLESKKIAKRVGFFENIIVLLKYIKPWSLKIGDKFIICTPWLKLNGKPRMEIFFKWCSVVMNVIFEKPGSSIVYIADKCEHVSYKPVQDICMFLAKYECAKLNNVKNKTIDLFSDEDAEVEFSDFNQYDDPENILAFPVKNSLTKISHLKKMMLDV